MTEKWSDEIRGSLMSYILTVVEPESWNKTRFIVSDRLTRSNLLLDGAQLKVKCGQNQLIDLVSN